MPIKAFVGGNNMIVLIGIIISWVLVVLDFPIVAMFLMIGMFVGNFKNTLDLRE